MQIDDVLMLVAMVSYTVLTVAMNIVSKSSSNLLPPDTNVATLTPQDIKDRVYGSKMVLVVEQMQCITIWLVKACLLLMYNRLTMSLKQNFAVKIVAGYAALTFVVMEILYFGVWCRPFTEYWAVPPDNVQCSAATNHLITNAVFNISSDLMIILIPMPIFIQSTLTLKRKLILIGVFAVGTFTIISAILNKYYSFTSPFGLDWTFWYIRESSTALITANLPLTWTLLQRVFRLGSFKERYGSSRTPSRPITASHFRSTAYGRSGMRTGTGEHGHGDGVSGLERGASQERINQSFHVPLKIYQKREVQITSVSAGPEDGLATRTRRGSGSDSLPDGMLTEVHVKGGRRASVHFEGSSSASSEKSVPGVIRKDST